MEKKTNSVLFIPAPEQHIRNGLNSSSSYVATAERILQHKWSKRPLLHKFTGIYLAQKKTEDCLLHFLYHLNNLCKATPERFYQKHGSFLCSVRKSNIQSNKIVVGKRVFDYYSGCGNPLLIHMNRLREHPQCA